MADKVLDTSKIKATLTRKVGPAPVWVWVVVGVGVLYVYKRATEPKAPAATTETGEATYADEGYPAYAGYGGTTSYDAGSASYDGGGGGAPESIPLTFEGSIPVDVTVSRPPRRHERDPRIAKITERIQALKEGGVTKAERPRVKRLRERRKRLRG